MAARSRHLCKDEEPAISFSDVNGDDQWIEHDLHHTDNEGTEERTSKTSTAGRGSFSRGDGLNGFTFKVSLLKRE